MVLFHHLAQAVDVISHAMVPAGAFCLRISMNTKVRRIRSLATPTQCRGLFPSSDGEPQRPRHSGGGMLFGEAGTHARLSLVA